MTGSIPAPDANGMVPLASVGSQPVKSLLAVHHSRTEYLRASSPTANRILTAWEYPGNTIKVVSHSSIWKRAHSRSHIWTAMGIQPKKLWAANVFQRQYRLYQLWRYDWRRIKYANYNRGNEINRCTTTWKAKFPQCWHRAQGACICPLVHWTVTDTPDVLDKAFRRWLRTSAIMKWVVRLCWTLKSWVSRNRRTGGNRLERSI